MKYYLYQFSDNWADEMDLEGFAILTETEKDMALSQIRKEYKHGGSICFGTNEDNEYDSLSDVMDTISFKEITAVEYNAIKKAFGKSSFGETGPLDFDFFEDDEEDEEEEYCDHCGEELDEDGYCSNCEEDDDDDFEEEYNAQANAISNFIKSEYGLEETPASDLHSNFLWKPTPNTEIHITVGAFEDGEEEVEVHLKYRGKNVTYEFFKVEDIYDNPGSHLRKLIKDLIEKAKKY